MGRRIRLLNPRAGLALMLLVGTTNPVKIAIVQAACRFLEGQIIKVDWQLTTAEARFKLKNLYLKIQP